MSKLHALQVKVLCGDTRCDECGYIEEYEDDTGDESAFVCSLWRATLKQDAEGVLRCEWCLGSEEEP